jgi:lambda family phage portal protein
MAADILNTVGRVFDRFIGIFDPDKGLSRQRARQLLVRAYEGASKRDGWNPRRPGASANTDHAADAGTLRVRSRALVQNVPYIAQGMRALVAAIIGTGIVPRWIGADAKVYEDTWKEWGKVCDADGRFDIYGLQAAAYRAQEQDGECLVRLRWRRPTDNLPVPLQLQLLEIDWLDSTKTMPNGTNQIVNGIEYDVLGKVMGYWLYDEHPGERLLKFRGRADSHFVPADSIIHFYTAERPGQGRGFPRISPVIARVRDMQLYEDAELQRKNLETRLSVLVSGDATELANPRTPNDPVDQTAAKAGDLGPLQSGGITQLPAGLNMQTVEPKAAPGYVDYVKHGLHLIAAGWGVTYEMMTGDMTGVNFSSARVARLNFQRQAEMEQWLHFLPKWDRISRAFADAMVLAGKVRRPNYNVEYSTPKWDYVNPEQEVKADLAEIAGGLSSFSEKLRKRGYNPDLVFTELETDINKLKKSGVLDVLLQLLKGKPLQEGGEVATSTADGQQA